MLEHDAANHRQQAALFHNPERVAIEEAVRRLRIVAAVVRLHGMSRDEAEADLRAADVFLPLTPAAQHVLQRLPLALAEVPDPTVEQVREAARLPDGWVDLVNRD